MSFVHVTCFDCSVASNAAWSPIVHVAHAGDGQFTTICQFRPTEHVSKLKYLSRDSIFCGACPGTIERWNTRAQLVITYRQPDKLVYAIDGNEERDLLF